MENNIALIKTDRRFYSPSLVSGRTRKDRTCFSPQSWPVERRNVKAWDQTIVQFDTCGQNQIIKESGKTANTIYFKKWNKISLEAGIWALRLGFGPRDEAYENISLTCLTAAFSLSSKIKYLSDNSCLLNSSLLATSPRPEMESNKGSELRIIYYVIAEEKMIQKMNLWFVS